MTNAQIVALGVRLFSIWLVLYLFGHTPGLWTFVEHAKSGSGYGFVVTVCALLVLAAVGLWFFPLAVARKLLPKATLDQPTPLPVDQVQRAGFCLLGLWVLTESVPYLVYYAVAFAASPSPNSLMSFEKDNYANVAHTIAEFVIGVWLLLGARGLLDVLRWARTAGSGEPGGAPAPSPAQHNADVSRHKTTGTGNVL